MYSVHSASDARATSNTARISSPEKLSSLSIKVTKCNDSHVIIDVTCMIPDRSILWTIVPARARLTISTSALHSANLVKHDKSGRIRENFPKYLNSTFLLSVMYQA